MCSIGRILPCWELLAHHSIWELRADQAAFFRCGHLGAHRPQLVLKPCRRYLLLAVNASIVCSLALDLTRNHGCIIRCTVEVIEDLDNQCICESCTGVDEFGILALLSGFQALRWCRGC